MYLNISSLASQFLVEPAFSKLRQKKPLMSERLGHGYFLSFQDGTSMCHSCHTAWRSNTKTKDENGSEASKVCVKRNSLLSCVILDFCWYEALLIDASDRTFLPTTF